MSRVFTCTRLWCPGSTGLQGFRPLTFAALKPDDCWAIRPSRDDAQRFIYRSPPSASGELCQQQGGTLPAATVNFTSALQVLVYLFVNGLLELSRELCTRTTIPKVFKKLTIVLRWQGSPPLAAPCSQSSP
jgi:hypothetical protein